MEWMGKWMGLTNPGVNSSTISQLELHCKIDYPVDVSVIPVFLDSTVYYATTRNGSFSAINLGACEYEWQASVNQTCWGLQPRSKLQHNNTIPLSRTSPKTEGLRWGLAVDYSQVYLTTMDFGQHGFRPA